MTSQFKKLSRQEQILMSKTLAKAFNSHDNFIYLIDQKDKRLSSANRLFRFMTKVMTKYGYIYVVNHNDLPVGYITFMDDDKHTMGIRTVLGSNAIWLAAKFWLSLSFKERKKYRTYMKTYKLLQHAENQYIHLYYTGIEPEYKGRGIMKLAMSEALDYFKELGYQGVTLETSDLGNVELYKHLGYRVTQSVTTTDERQEIFKFEKVF